VRRMSASLAPRLNFASRRTSAQDGSEVTTTHEFLSEFQVVKLSYFFNKFFDSNHDHVIDLKDLSGLNARLGAVSGWGLTDPKYQTMIDANRVFMECLLDQVKMENRDAEGLEQRSWDEALAPRKMKVTSVSLKAWLNMWGRLCKGSAGIDDFPIWVQLIPEVLFNAIVAKEGTSLITRESLKNFYTNFIGLDENEVEKTSTDGFRIISANGDYEVNLDHYKLLFSNFLLGRTIYGPGKYIFGCFDNRDMDEQYKVIFE